MRYLIILSLFIGNLSFAYYDDPRDYEYTVTTTQTGPNSYRVTTDRKMKEGTLGLLAVKVVIMSALAYWLVKDHYIDKARKRAIKDSSNFEKQKHLVAQFKGE